MTACFEPRCVHCGQRFETWRAARIRVKRCKAGKHPRKRRSAKARTLAEIYLL